MTAALVVLGGVVIIALLAIAALLVHAMRRESEAWRSLLATVTTTPVMIDHVHRVHDETMRDARRLVRVATIGREETAPTRRTRGSPPPEARASRIIQDETIATMGLRIQQMYREGDVVKPLEECMREAQELLAGELAG